MIYDYEKDNGFGYDPEEDWNTLCTRAEVTTNFTISKSDNNTYLVRGDSERFGKNAILFESFKKSECEAYVGRNGGTPTDKTMSCKGFRVTRKIKDGSFSVEFNLNGRQRKSIFPNFQRAAMFVWDMANNNDHGAMVNHKMCRVFGELCT